MTPEQADVFKRCFFPPCFEQVKASTTTRLVWESLAILWVGHGLGAGYCPCVSLVLRECRQQGRCLAEQSLTVEQVLLNYKGIQVTEALLTFLHNTIRMEILVNVQGALTTCHGFHTHF